VAAIPVDFRQIRSLEGRQDVAFEEFCCQVARRAGDVPPGSKFTRYYGAGGDGGVECVWTLPNGEEWGWQAKYLFKLNKPQLDKSVETALSIHPRLTRYTICLPFDFAPPTSRQGKSQAERYAEYEQQWRALAEAQGMQVEFLCLCRSHLLDEVLRFDPYGGRLRFWFDKEYFGDEWFKKHLDETATAAKPRYTPYLSVEVPVAAAFEALGRTPQWEQSVSDLIKKIHKVSEDWENTCAGRRGFGGPEDREFPEAAKDSARRLTARLGSIKQILQGFLANAQGLDLSAELGELGEALDLAEKCLAAAAEDLEAKHGKGMADSVGFRQFMAEYHVSFPAQHVDAARDVITALKELRDWLSRPESSLPASSAMLLLGPAGIGKTHSICDIALDRHGLGLRSIALLGEKFSHISGEPWERIRSLLGLSADVSRDELFGILDAAGQCTGYPLIIFIDALNETEPREFWYDSLVGLARQVGQYAWLKLCVSCRSTYYEDTVAPNVQIPKVEHMGFAGVEFDACFEFFQFYDLEPPSMPLMQPEFSNPLFLRLVCESLKDAGVKRLPEGMVGISDVVRYLLDSKNKKLARALDYDPKEQLVQRAVDLVVSSMQENRARWLLWQKAKELVESVWPFPQRKSSLFDHLIREGLFREDRVRDNPDGSAQDAIFVSFERLSDYLVAQRYLAEIEKDSPAVEASGRLVEELLCAAFASGGILHHTVASKDAIHENRGLLDALAIVIPERFDLELVDLVDEDWRTRTDSTLITLAVVESLMWRADDSVGSRAQDIVWNALRDSETFAPAMEMLFVLSTRAENPLNAYWLYDLLVTTPMPDRDAFLSPYLHRTYGQQKGLDRLVRWALKADVEAISDKVTELWAVQLCWFCSASDRRVRDYATKALVRLMEVHVSRWPGVISRIRWVDDEYVVERCLAAAYGSLIRANRDDATAKTALAVYEMLFEDGFLPQNAMMRDYARSILELAAHRNLLPGHLTPEQFRPPYESEWPLDWPDEDFVEQYKDSYRELPKLYHSCLKDDFAIYTVEDALRGYKGIEKTQALRWIFKHILDMGYTAERFADFDGYMLSKYGHGRSKPDWAERIGKKYQWIALYRLMARVADHLPTDCPELTPSLIPDLQALGERNIDPTILIAGDQRSQSTTWWAPVDYNFEAVSALSDDEWLDVKDFPDSAAMLEVKDLEDERAWLVLEAHLGWRSKSDDAEDRYPYRWIWMQVRSYLVSRADWQRCWKWLRRQDFNGRWMPEGFEIYGGFLGEYPWGVPITRFLEESYFEQPRGLHGRRGYSGVPCSMLPTVHWVSCNHQFDAYQENTISVLAPAEVFFNNDDALHWNAISGYRSGSGRLCFDYPATVQVGPPALLVDKEYLSAYLEKNDLVLAWTVLAEKQCTHDILADHNLGYAGHSRAHMLIDNEVRNARGITYRFKPERTTDADPDCPR
jgi:hypothetical protein